MADYDLKPRESWDTSGYDGYKTNRRIDVTMAPFVQHHTAGEFVEPEPIEWYQDEEDPRPPHLGVIRTFRAGEKLSSQRSFREKVPARRRWNTDPEFEAKREDYGKITQWAEIEHRRSGAEVDDQGRYQWVSVRINLKRIQQLREKRKARNAIRNAKLTRIQYLERRAMRAMDRYHKGIGYKGIGYSSVGFSRRIYAGRAEFSEGRVMKAWYGAHTGQAGWNRYYGHSWAGDFTKRRLPKITRKATVAFLRSLRSAWYGAHRDVFATACPGEKPPAIASIAKDAGTRRPRL